jgi:hypothetical protein
VGDLVAFADSTHVGAVGLAIGSDVRFLTEHDARVRGHSHDEVPMEPTIYGWVVASAMITLVSCRTRLPDGEDGENEPMWSLELASARERLDATWAAHALAESEPLTTTALALLSPKHLTVDRADFVTEALSDNEHITRSVLGMPSPAPFSAFATNIFTKLRADISDHVNFLRFPNLVSTLSNPARPKSRRFASRLNHGDPALLASEPPTTSRLGVLRDK